MRAAANCALAGRQVITALVRAVFTEFFPTARLRVLCDVSHNTCRAEYHAVSGKRRLLHVHRKGATRSLGPGHPDVSKRYAGLGDPILIGGSMPSPPGESLVLDAFDGPGASPADRREHPA